MEIKILFNTEAITKELAVGWGFSALIDGHILFDTGENGNAILNNINRMKIDISRIESVFISHNHWDHTGGLWEILKHRRGMIVYALSHFGHEFETKVKHLGGRFVDSGNFLEISKNIYLTGEIPGFYHDLFMPEQSLVIKTENGISVITGCAHPGILKILERVKKQLHVNRFHLVLGGFHLKNQDPGEIRMIVQKFKEMNCEKVGPTHCSGMDAEAFFKEVYQERCISIKVGQTLHI